MHEDVCKGEVGISQKISKIIKQDINRKETRKYKNIEAFKNTVSF